MISLGSCPVYKCTNVVTQEELMIKRETLTQHRLDTEASIYRSLVKLLTGERHGDLSGLFALLHPGAADP